MMGGDLKVVAAMYPPDGLDWAELTADPEAERRYREIAAPLLARDFEMLPVQPRGPRKTVIVGVEAYLAGMRVVMEGFDRFRLTPEGFVALDGGVLVLARLDGAMADGGRSFSGSGGAIFELKGGLIRRIREFDNRGDLFAVAGITAEEVERRVVAPDLAAKAAQAPENVPPAWPHQGTRTFM